MPSPNNNLAEQARKLLDQSSSGSLATQSLKHPGFPFVSLVQYTTSECGEPLLLLSSMATHSRNIQKHNQVSLLIRNDPHEPAGSTDAKSNSADEQVENGMTNKDSASELSAARLTLIGTIAPVSKDQEASARQRYLSKHPEAQQWISFGDFQLFQLSILDCYLVAGFGSMGWVSAAELRSRKNE